MAGKTEDELIEESIDYISYFYSMVQTGMGFLKNMKQGFIKVLAQKSDRRLLGFHIMLPNASEIIMICQMALETKMTVQQFVSVDFPHPTESEHLKMAVCGLMEIMK